MRRLILLICIAALCGISPSRKILLAGYNPAAEELFLESQGPTADLNIPASEVEVGPIVHLLMEDNAASTAVVNKANVAINGTASANTNTFTTATGKILRGLAFVVATSHLIDMGSDVIGTGADSACMWVNPASVAVGVDQYLISNGKFILYINDPGANALEFTSDGATVITGGTGISAGAFSHVCVVRDAAGAATIYLNGTADNATAASGSPTGGTGNVFIGNRADGAKDFGGTLDDVRIYNYALSPAQIAHIYNQGAGHQNLASKAKANMLTVDATPAVMSVQDKQGVEFYQSTAASRPILTTMNGKQALWFDGVDDGLVSLTTLGNVFSNASATAFFSLQPNLLNVYQTFFTDSTPATYAQIVNANSRAQITNDDGAGDTAASPIGSLSTSTPVILMYDHSSGVISLHANRRVGAANASGNTATLTGSLYVGSYVATSQFYNGLIQRLTTFNKVLSPYARDRISKHLCRQAGASCN